MTCIDYATKWVEEKEFVRAIEQAVSNLYLRRFLFDMGYLMR